MREDVESVAFFFFFTPNKTMEVYLFLCKTSEIKSEPAKIITE